MLILAFPEYSLQAQTFWLRRWALRYKSYFWHHFPDSESLLRLPVDLPDHVIIWSQPESTQR